MPRFKGAYDLAPRLPKAAKAKPQHCPVPMDDDDEDTKPDVTGVADGGDRGPFIQTHMGVHFHLLDPRESEIHLDDIAWALSHLNRYTGHAIRPYNVAEHSVHVMRWLRAQGWPPHVQLGGLMHDAAEAYVGDVAKPLKVLLEPAYSSIEHGIAAKIQNRFRIRLTADERAAVKQGDIVMLATELPALVNYRDKHGGVGEGLPEPWADAGIMNWSPVIARWRFLAEAKRLGL